MVEASSLVKYGALRLKDIADRPFSEARLLLAYTINCSVSDIIVKSDLKISQELEKKYKQYIEKRASAMPMAYITGKQEFYGLEFEVKQGVLIPRADTETLVEYILKQNIETMLDICTGSGCIAIAAAVKNPNIKCTAVDLSETALDAAMANAGKHGVNIEFIRADVLSCDFNLDKKFDMIVSNPPYIKTEDINGLMPDVKNYEPHLALDGGVSGLVFYEKICELALLHLIRGGILAFEIGQGQDTEIAAILGGHFKNIGTIPDLAGIKRVIYGEF